MTSSQHGPYVLGYTHATMAGTTGCETARWSESLKAGLSSDCRLQLAYMKPELLVTAGQHTAVNMFPKSGRPSGLRKTRRESNSLAHRTTWLRSDFGLRNREVERIP